MLNDIRLPLPSQLIAHREAVAVLTQAGLPIPAKWRKLDAQLTDYLELESASLARLVDSVTHPDAKDDRIVLRGLAVAEAAATHASVAQVNNAVVDAVLTKLQDTITAVAPDLYQRAAAAFDEAAAAFTACASVVDPETSAEVVVSKLVGKDEPAGVAWTNAEQHAARLTLLMAPLTTAATLCGIGGLDPDIPDDPGLMPLIADLSACHVRRAWQAWLDSQDGTRTGRWGRMLRAGAILRACPISEHQPYPPPLPLEARQERLANGGIRNIEVDPHDADYRPEAIDPTRPVKRTLVVGGGL